MKNWNNIWTVTFERPILQLNPFALEKILWVENEVQWEINWNVIKIIGNEIEKVRDAANRIIDFLEWDVLNPCIEINI